MLRGATLRIVELYDQYLTPTGVTARQFSVLRFIAMNSPITVTDLAAHMKLERSTLSRNIKLLTEKGYLTYTTLKGRGKRLELTDYGAETFAKASKEWEKAQQKFENKLGDTQFRQWNEIITCLLNE